MREALSVKEDWLLDGLDLVACFPRRSLFFGVLLLELLLIHAKPLFLSFISKYTVKVGVPRLQ